MPIHRDKKRGTYVFEFDRVIPDKGRVRARKRLPKAWTVAQADEFDRKESARLYAIATGVGKPQEVEHRIDEAVAHFLRDRIPHMKTGNDIARELANIFYLYNHRPLSALHDVVKEIKAMKRIKGDLKKPLAPATIRNRIRYLVSACRWGWTEHKLCDHDPAEGISVPEVKNERQVYIDRAQMLQAARACTNRKARMAIRIGFYSGMRLGEMMRAVLTPKGWHLETTKNDDPRIIPVHPKAAVCARLFPKMKGARITIQRNWERARARVGLPHVHWHDLRHSTASAMVNNGVDLFVVGRVLGHKDPRSTARYAHLNVDALTAAVAKVK